MHVVWLMTISVATPIHFGKGRERVKKKKEKQFRAS